MTQPPSRYYELSNTRHQQ